MNSWEREENWRLFMEGCADKPEIIELLRILGMTANENEEERNDVYIYETLLYPPRSSPPNAN